MHIHKWGHFNHNGRESYTCIDPDCSGPIMDIEEAERRLNAVEMLSANDAMKACQFIPQHEIPETGKWNAESRLVDALSEYAHILEGETT